MLQGTRRRIGVVVFLVGTLIVLSPFVLAEGFYLLGGTVFTRLPGVARTLLDERTGMGMERLLPIKVRSWFLK